MSTWNRKRREEMAKRQADVPKKKKQVYCRLCDKVHDHPVHRRRQVRAFRFLERVQTS